MNEELVSDQEKTAAAEVAQDAINRVLTSGIVNPDNINSISISIHRVLLRDIPEDWTIEKIGTGDDSSLVARIKVGPVSVTAHLAK